MNKTLDELDAEESRIMDQVDLITGSRGTIEEQKEKLYKVGFFTKYREVHRSYIGIIKNGTGSQKFEALKRALFIQWIGSFEPSCITGIEFESIESANDGITWKDVEFVYSELNILLSKNELDKELFAMLSYYSNWDFAFQVKPFLKFKNLQHFINQYSESSGDNIQKIREFNLAGRGQMGKYFLSLNISTV